MLPGLPSLRSAHQSRPHRRSPRTWPKLHGHLLKFLVCNVIHDYQSRNQRHDSSLTLECRDASIHHCWGFKVTNRSICKFRGLQMVQFECTRVIHPLVSFTFGVHCGVPFSLNAGKGKCCMRLVDKVENHFAKIGFVDCKWSNLNAPGSYTLCCPSLLGYNRLHA